MFEVVTSEASYLRSLLVAVSHFQLSPGLRGALTGAELRQLFSNLSQVKDVSERFLLQLEEHLDQDVFLPGLGEVVLRHCPAFRRVYVPYVTNQIHQERLMQQLMKRPGRFLRVLCKLEEQPVCQRQPLKSFLVLPFQRITRLKILLQVGRPLLHQICKAAWPVTAVYFPFGFKNILKWTGPDSELAKSVGLAHKAVGEIVSQCNENLRLMKQKEELVMLEKRMDFSKVKGNGAASLCNMERTKCIEFSSIILSVPESNSWQNICNLKRFSILLQRKIMMEILRSTLLPMVCFALFFEGGNVRLFGGRADA
ncbi:rho guanine nucleotide exchange factor 19-like isoform X4 [Python bivittatus]|uniref:Rho guanine nucleotide exchange factor 19-like isoform X4 n=1 Tax=Python bivittatus TaxID=176946 RepID=A0A9F5IQP6_PYTBI|nr:rho guanine nucleotide exchange factor 19-like isoform X4 [Python bivittatus]